MSGIHTCVLNSCLWTPVGDLCYGCGNGSGGACVGLGTGSETSAVHGKLISSVFASYPETVIWRGHRLHQAQDKGQYIGSAYLSPSQTFLSNKYPEHQHPPLPATPMPTQKAHHPQGGHLPSGPHATNKMPVGKFNLLGTSYIKLPPLM